MSRPRKFLQVEGLRQRPPTTVTILFDGASVKVLRSASSSWNSRGGKEKGPKGMAGVAVGQNKTNRRGRICRGIRSGEVGIRWVTGPPGFVPKAPKILLLYLHGAHGKRAPGGREHRLTGGVLGQAPFSVFTPGRDRNNDARMAPGTRLRRFF